MIRKRTALMAAVLVLLMGLTTSTFAAGGSTVITAEFVQADITIEVTIPGGQSQTFINPENYSVEIDGKVEDGQIISMPMYIENQSEIPLLVSTSVTGVAKGGLDLRGSTTLGTTSRAKRVFVYFQLRAAAGPEDVDWGDGYDADKDIVVRTTTKKKTDYVTLAAKDQEDRYGVFRLSGDCVAEPKIEWTEEDGFAATIVFTFKAGPLS